MFIEIDPQVVVLLGVVVIAYYTLRYRGHLRAVFRHDEVSVEVKAQLKHPPDDVESNPLNADLKPHFTARVQGAKKVENVPKGVPSDKIRDTT